MSSLCELACRSMVASIITQAVRDYLRPERRVKDMANGLAFTSAKEWLWSETADLYASWVGMDIEAIRERITTMTPEEDRIWESFNRWSWGGRRV